MPNRSQYLLQLDDLRDAIGRFGQKAIGDINALNEALAGDSDAATRVLEGNKASHRMRSSIEDSCLNIMLLQQPLVGDDLRFVSGAFRVVSDLSHIDEMTRDVAQLSQQLSAEAVALMGDAFEQSISKVSSMLDLAVQSFLDDDEAKAKEVSAADDEVDALYEASQAKVVQLIRSTSDTATHMPELLMVAKYFERMGDDAEHIADWAIFRVTGERPVRSRDAKGPQD